MTDVRGYSPQQTGTIADVVEQGPDLRQVSPAGPDSFKAPPSWSQMFSAARPEALRATPGYDDAKIGEGYAPIVDALGLPASENPGYFNGLDPAAQARFGNASRPSQLATSARQGEKVPFGSNYLADRPLQESLVLAQLKARRAKDPNFLPDVPDDPQALHAYFEQQQAQKRAAGGAVLARGSFLGRTSANLAAGGVESAINDPTFLPTMVLGGGMEGGVLQAVGRDALINGVLAASQQPIQARNMAENGEHLTLADAAGQVAGATVIGGAIGGTIHLTATHLPPALFKIMPESVQQRWAGRMKIGENGPLLKDVLGDMNNRELATFARSSIGAHMTPDETAAANALERNQELGEASPFMPGPAGDSAHNANLADALKSTIDGIQGGADRGSLLSSASPIATRSLLPITADVGRATAPHDIVAFFKAKGLDDAHAYGIAAGIAAESRGGDHTAINPTSGALGLGQWLGSRKAALVERYGANPSRGEQLEFLWHELQGGDPGGRHVLAAGDAGSVLDAYIRKFMRPAAGAETLGDLQRGMEALGHKGELPEAAAGDASADDSEALQRSADDADAEAIAAASDRDHLDAELGQPHEPDAADMPILKRELFGDDSDWFEAQLGFYRSQGLVGDAAEAAENGARSASEPVEAVGQPEGASGPPAVPQRLQDWLAGTRIVDEHGRPLVAYHGTAWNFDRFDLDKAGAGRGNPDERALFFATDPETASHSAEVMGAGHATGEPTHTGALTDNGGVVYPVYLKAENPFVSDLRGYFSHDVVRELRKAREAGHDAVIFPHIKQRGEAGTIAVFDPDQVRSIFDAHLDVLIDAPELKAFDEGGSGRAEQADSLEHDVRMDASADSAFAPEHPELAGDWKATIDKLEADKRGSVPGALEHADIGKIDVVWGEAGSRKSDGYGLAKIAKFHPEVLAELPAIVRDMPIIERSANRIRLESADHMAAVRLDFDGERKTWLLTAFAKGKKASALAEDGRVSAGGRDGSPGLEVDRNIRASIDRGNARTYRLTDDGPAQTLTDILADLDRDRDAAAALRACAAPKGDK